MAKLESYLVLFDLSETTTKTTKVKDNELIFVILGLCRQIEKRDEGIWLPASIPRRKWCQGYKKRMQPRIILKTLDSYCFYMEDSFSK